MRFGASWFSTSAFSTYLLLLVAFVSSANAQTTAPGEWTWMGGSNTVPGEFGISPGVYGTLGVPAPGNIPPGRYEGASWTDNNGHLWLFGGLNFPNQLNYFNDLWEFDPSTNEWAWMAGSNTVATNCPVISTLANCGQPGVYGTLGTPAPGNIPGGREESEYWTDLGGHLWLYGGQGFDANGNLVSLNDLWEFDPSTNLWTWMGGSSTVPIDETCNGCISAIPPVTGTLGVPAAGNTPGGLSMASNWTDQSGNFWLFSGWGYGVPNDLWELNAASLEWTWVGGASDFGIDGPALGTYGTLGIQAPGNTAGWRTGAATWKDDNGNLWLFGGWGVAAALPQGILNDLWEYSPRTNEWAWMGGSSTLNCANYPDEYCHQSGVYGMLGQPAAGNIPGSRYESSSWKDAKGNFWLFGGLGFDANSDWSQLNDLWEVNPSTNEWAWMGGSSVVNNGPISGVYGTLGIPGAENLPGIRASATSWTDKDGNFWLWGGTGFDANGTYGTLNDLWRYQTLPQSATPVLSPEGGTFATTQTITIADATPGATIYYTTNGTTPTTNSAVYTSPIIISSTERLEAIAMASGYSTSVVASAAYTIPPNFAVAINPASVSVQAGQSGTTTITVQDEGGFNSNISFTCSGLPSGDTCAFSTLTVPTPAGVTYSTLTVSTALNSAAIHPNFHPLFPESALAAAVCFLSWRRRRRWQLLILLAVSAAGLGFLNACVFKGSNSSGGGTQPVTTTVTVTATSGSLSHTTTFSLTVN